MWFRRCLSLTVLLATACGSSGGGKFAPVSGKITMNGEPLANAMINFQPIVPEGTTDPPAPSGAKTNEKGEFTLESADGTKGAWVGKHQVRISLWIDVGDLRPERRVGKTQGEQVPLKYNKASKEEFDVPAGGTDQANFTLTKP